MFQARVRCFWRVGASIVAFIGPMKSRLTGSDSPAYSKIAHKTRTAIAYIKEAYAVEVTASSLT